MKKSILFLCLLVLIANVSCQKDSLLINKDLVTNFYTSEKSQESIITEVDSIIELQSGSLQKLPETGSRTTRSYSYGDDSGIDGAVGMPVNIVVKQNPYGARYVTYKGANQECKLESVSNQDNQKFFLRQMPLTGLFYFTPFSNSSYLLSAGSYSSNPDVYVLYVKDNTNSIGAVWNIHKGSSDDTSFVLKNEDLSEQGSRGWWDVYSLALGVNTNNGSLNFSRYVEGCRTQEFEIRPCDDFVVTEMTLSEYGSSSITDEPDFVITESYKNNGSSEQTMSTKITQRAQETSSFSRKTSLSTNISTSGKVNAFFAEGTISMSVGASQDWTYGETETRSDDREYNFPLVIAPYKQINVTISVSRKKAIINYRAKLRGVTTGYEMWEEGTWENVDCTNIAINLDEYDLRTGAQTGARTITGVPNSPIKIIKNLDDTIILEPNNGLESK